MKNLIPSEITTINLIKGESNINGTGIFTIEPVAKDTEFYVIPLTIVFQKPQAKCARIADKKYVHDNAVLNSVNHSCNPNTILDIDRPDPVLKAIRDISANEEISVNYNQTEVQGVSVECSCKAVNCKGFFDRL